MPLEIEKVPLTPELMSDPDVDWTLKALQSIGITSADKALNNWRISIVTRGEWEKIKGTSAIHLFPWDEETEAGRPDKAWFNVGINYDGIRYVVCQRTIAGTSNHLNLISEKVPEDSYPRKWDSLNFYSNGMGANLHFGAENEVISVWGHDDSGYFTTRVEKDGQKGIDEALKRIGSDLGINPEEMPGVITFNPGQIANSVLDQRLIGDIPQMLQKVIYNI